MGNINTITISGNITKDPEIKYFESGNSKTSFTIAVNDWNSKEKKADVYFIPCELWNKAGEFIGEYAHKGSKVCVQGRLKYSEFEKDKQTIRRWYIAANTADLMQLAEKQETKETEQSDENSVEFGEEEIPF